MDAVSSGMIRIQVLKQQNTTFWFVVAFKKKKTIETIQWL